ncbi:MAG TPA: HoxN/HupN/NixA family nickel/cobalt transporter [Thermoplasmata archaeon]|nr:HoxN/HupN/NixA family nickel/cobalt transporter [Thermoplasmata archaeon]
MAGSVVALSGPEKLRAALLLGAIGAVTALAFVASILIGERYVLLAGLGVIAYVFGLRHGVDADHIAAIDNTTRKLLQEGKRPLSVGAWFSLGHSTIVIALIVALVFATRSVASAIPALRGAGSVIGTGVSGTFLWVIGLVNLVIVLEIYRIFQGLRAGRFSPEQLEEQLNQRGFLNRYFGRFFRVVESPWQIYPIGVLFGLGFDTASEVALIGISVGVGLTAAVPVWMVLVLPLMFTCGMMLVDTADAIAMRVAYGWAFLKPVRKIYYNLTITIISVLVALAVGTVELLQVLAGELGLTGGFWGALATLDFETLGFVIVGIFVGAWLLAIAYYRYRRFEDLPPPGGFDPHRART